MTINFNVEPYHDDFDENKKFVRILFRPGYAVQARELTQLQTIIQKQIERQGNHLFKDGAMVVPGQISFDNTYNYVKLVATNNNTQTDSIIDTFVGKDIIGSTTGVDARVVNVTRGSANGGVPLLHVKYNSSGDDNVTQVFAANETLTIVAEEQQNQLEVKTTSSSPCGVGSAVSIQAGVYYVKGYFIYVEPQTVVLQYNSITPSYKVGLKITEGIVTPEEDETLLDNAQNSYNYTAPGAHRYAIYLTLTKVSVDSTDDVNFIELLRVVNGKIQYIVDKTQYAELEKTLARRTYDESGNYTVTPFGIQVKEYRNNNRGAWARNRVYLYGDIVSYYNTTTKKTEYYTCLETGTSTANTNVNSPLNDDISWELTAAPVYNRGVNQPNTDATLLENQQMESKLAIGIEPGKAYVYGYEIEKQSIDYVNIDKARETDSREQLLIPADMGNYVIVRNLNGYPDLAQLEQVKIFDAPRAINVSGEIMDSSSVKGVTITNGGSGYTSTPAVLFSTPEKPWGTQATGVATISGAGVTTITLNSAGDGYTAIPTITIKAAEGDSGSGATATAKLTGGSVNGYAITVGGTKYLEVPSVTISAPKVAGGATATATATILNGAVTALTISGGSGYDGVPTITIAAPKRTVSTANVDITTDTITYNSHGLSNGNTVIYKNGGGTSITGLANDATYFVVSATANTFKVSDTLNGSAKDLSGTGNNAQYFEIITGATNALAYATISASGISSITVTAAGSGYKIAPTVVISAPSTGNAASATANIGSSTVTGVTITNPGSGYASAPSVSFSSGGGSNATATATVSPGTTVEVNSTVGLVEGMELSKISGVGVFGAGSKIDSIDDDTHFTMTTSSTTNGQIVFNAILSGTEVGTARVRSFELHSQGETDEDTEYKMFLFDINMYYYDVPLKKKYSFIISAKNFTNDLVTPSASTFSANTVLNIDQRSGSVKVFGPTIFGTLTKFKTEFSVGDFVFVNDRLRRISNIKDDYTMSVHWSAGSSGNDNYLPIYHAVRPLYGSNAVSLLFPLPNYSVTNVNHVTYSIRKYFGNNVVSSGEFTLNVPSDEQFVPSSGSGNYLLFSVNTGKPITYSSSSLGSGNNSITFSGVSAPNGTNVVVIATIFKSLDIGDDLTGIISKQKELETEEYTVTSQTIATSQQIFLGKSDGVKLKSVMMKSGTFASPGTKLTDITSRYTFNNGQTESYYGPCSISLRNGQPVPTGQLVVTFQYFNHTNLHHDFFTSNSYIADYKTIPTFKGFNLRDCIDFRPRLGDGSYDGSLTIPSTAPVFTKFGEEFAVSYDYYLSRKTNIFINKDGSFSTTDSASDLNPKEPDPKTDAMLVYRLHLEPYTFTTTNSSVIVNTVDNKRYTMRDIGKLEKRINNLEYYTSLSMLEQQTKSMTVLDADGFDRFKSGFVVDNFTGHIVGDSNNQDYVCSMDFEQGELRPFYSMENIDFVEVIQNKSVSSDADYQQARKNKNYMLTGDLVTLKYTDKELIKQPFASRTENINPFAIFTFIGNAELTPALDHWFEVKRRPDIIVNVEGNYSTIKSLAEKAGVLGTVWNAWQTQWVGASTTSQRTYTSGWLTITEEITATPIGQSRSGIKTSVQEKIEYKTVDDKVLSVAVIPYIRSRQILVQARGLKPKTKFYPYFDKTGVSAYCTPASKIVISVTQGNYDRFDIDENVGNDYKEPARAFGPNPEFSLNVGDAIYVSGRSNTAFTYENSTVTAIVVGKEYSITNKTYALYVVNVKDSVTTDGIGFLVGDTIKGSISGSTATVISYTPAVVGGDLVTNFNGDLNFLYEIPNTDAMRFRCGNRELSLFESSTYPALITGSRVIKSYSAEGRLETRQATIQAIRNAEIVQEAVSATQTITQTSSRILNVIDNTPAPPPPEPTWVDPLAQTFLVDMPGGCFLTKIDVYFATKDTEKPVTVQIREVVNGYPGKVILPFSEVSVKPELINADTTGKAATSIKFKSPVFVEHNKEYAICLLSNSDNYNVWISQMGEKNINSDQLISTQPYAGVLFKSQNASTWTAEQWQDLKFTLYRAKFQTEVIATVDFENQILPDAELQTNPFQFTKDSNKVRVNHIGHGMVSTAGISTVSNGERSSIVQFRKVGDVMTGTIQINNSSTAVTGVGTLFQDELEVGASLYRQDNVYIGTVSAISSDTSLTLTANPTMSNSTGIAYRAINKINGVNPVDIFNKKFIVSNVELDSYVITLDAGINPTESTVDGGAFVYATRDVQYDAIQPLVALQNFPKTKVNYVYRGIRTKSVDGTQIPYDYITSWIPITINDISVTINEYNAMPVPMSVASDLNCIYEVNSSGEIVTRTTPLNLSKESTSVRNSAILRLQFETEIDNVSPVFDIRNISVIAIANKINNPSTSMNVVELDDREVVGGLQEGTDVVLTSGTTSKLDLSDADISIQNKIKTIRSGQYITISGSKATANNKSWLVTDVDPDGEYIYVSGSIVTNGTNSAGDDFTITSKDRYFSEITPVGSSAYSKYVTKKINFNTPSTTLKIMMAAYVPPRANVDVYYKISKVEDYEDFEYVEWVLASNSTTFTKSDSVNTFIDTELDIENLPQFNAMSVKLVFRSIDSTQVPVIKDLRIIACA